jgi:hypothetical protein
MITYDLQSLQDYFNDIATPKEVVSNLYKIMANYARSVDADNFDLMQDGVDFLFLLTEYIDSVEPMKNQVPKV